VNETHWALIGALAGALLAGGMSLIGVRFTLRHTERLADHTRRDAHRAYLPEQRREAYSNHIAAVLEAETRIDLEGDDGGHVPLTAAEIHALQAKIVHAQGIMMIFGSGPAVRASSQSMGEIIDGLRGVSGQTGSRDGLGRLVVTARDEFRGDFVDD
jgi:hypothetical protein